MSDTSWNTTPWDNNHGTTGEASKFCPNCGEKIPVNAAFCPFCGFRFEGISQGNPQESRPAPYPSEPQPTDYSPDSQSAVYQQPVDQPIPPVYTVPDVQGESDGRKKKSNLPAIFAVVFAAIAAMLVGFLFIAPLIAGRSGSAASADTAQMGEGQTVNEEAQTAEAAPATEAAAGNDAEVEAEPTAVPTATPIPTATPTPIPTATPTEVPPQTISQPNIIDASTGQPISIPNDTADSFAYPDSGSRVWSYGDVNGMTAGQVRYCINEIYAKHGYIFQNENWLTYFKQKSWYSPTVPKASFGDNYLNANEVANVKLLNQYYADRKFPDY